MSSPLTDPRAAEGAPRKAYRNPDEAILGGVAAGLAEHLRLPVLWVRVAFMVSAVMGGFGVVFYAGLWMVLPARSHFDDQAPGLAAAQRQGKRPRRIRRRLADFGPLVATGAIAIGVAGFLALATGAGGLFWPVLLATAGVAVLWRQADEAQRERWLDSTGRINVVRAVVGLGGAASYLRLLLGAVLLVAAITVFSLASGDWGAARNVGLAAILCFIGLGFIVGPWLFRLSSDLSEERAERIRSQERADVAAHLHDSVLQTLALIQKSAHDATTVQRLARAQERDLRSWLFDSTGGDPTTFAAALRTIAGEVDDAYGVPVEVVCVGDPPVSERLRPIVLATREAVVNAARHAQAAKVDVYAEATPDRVEVFVRDRGTGFDAEEVAPDRHGLRDSIIDRMQRHGGTAVVKSRPGEGTEVRLDLPIERES